MTAREWKPGDVAMGRYGRVFYSGDKDRGSWTFDDGSGGYDNDFGPLQSNEPAGIRPLVVIDPEDREQVTALVELLVERGWRCTEAHGLRDALREFADPKPRVEVVTGDGALIACEYDGKSGRAVRLGGAWTFYGECLRDHGAIWDDFDAVEVLSEGVTA